MTVPFHTVSLAAIGAAAGASAVAYHFLPARIATHFDEDGQADRYSSRVSAAVTMPAVMGALLAANDLFGSWPGGRDRQEGDTGAQARDQAIGLIESALLASQLAVLANGVGLPVNMSRVSRGVLGALMIGLGNVMPKLPRNGLIGMRTPWTLSDPAVWERTHRLGGYVFTAAGLIGLATVPPSDKRVARLPLAVVLGAVVLLVLYSFVISRKSGRFAR